MSDQYTYRMSTGGPIMTTTTTETAKEVLRGYGRANEGSPQKTEFKVR